MVHRSSLATKQTIGSSLLSSYPGQTSCLPLVTTHTDTRWKSQNLCTGNTVHQVVAKDSQSSRVVDLT
jgi:hypothetical protein